MKKQPSPVLEVEATLKILPIHGGVENLGIHYGVVMNRFAFASCMRPYRRDVRGKGTPVGQTEKELKLLDQLQYHF